ncbi:unnamed protein product [Linum tenue]|uniref:FRIGIDA-like protein n=1 Tax=Linum tenue TaxID=586396 RepID=A0AAV0RPF0_9ROSI|nr:unnamed protein product [Linum tenue]
MGSIPDPGEVTADLTPPPPSFDDFQRQTSLMTSCTLLWKELSDHFTTLEQNLQKTSDALKRKIQALDTETKDSLASLKKREVTIDGSVEIALERLDDRCEAALRSIDSDLGEVDDGDGLLLALKTFCLKMSSREFWRFVITKKKELDALRSQIPLALGECVDPPRRGERSEKGNDLGWACVVILESLIPVVMDPVIGKSRLMVTPMVKKRASEIAETWKRSLEERGGIENVKTPDVHTFLQHLVTFGIVRKEDFDLYRKLVVGSAWRKQMPKLAVSLGLGGEMPDMIKELIGRGQRLDAVHFTYEQLAVRKEQSALRAVIKCIEEYNLEAEFPPENLKKSLEQLKKVKTEKKKPVPAAIPANKRTRASTAGPMPPAKAGRLTNAYVSSFSS